MSEYQYDYNELTEEVLFQRYAGGDMKAFDVLLARLKGLVYSLILRYVKNSAIADEIFQDVFLKVCRNKDQFRHATSFKSWLATITRNTCIDYTRKDKRQLKTNPLDDYSDEGSGPLAERVADEDAISPADLTNIKLENAELEKLLDELPSEQKETFYMKVVMEMTFEEIGESMNCSTNTAKSRYRYAVTTLKKIVGRKQLLESIA